MRLSTAGLDWSVFDGSDWPSHTGDFQQGAITGGHRCRTRHAHSHTYEIGVYVHMHTQSHTYTSTVLHLYVGNAIKYGK